MLLIPKVGVQKYTMPFNQYLQQPYIYYNIPDLCHDNDMRFETVASFSFLNLDVCSDYLFQASDFCCSCVIVLIHVSLFCVTQHMVSRHVCRDSLSYMHFCKVVAS